MVSLNNGLHLLEAVLRPIIHIAVIEVDLAGERNINVLQEGKI